MSLHSKVPDASDRQKARLILQTAVMSSLPVDKQQWLSDQLALVAIEKSNRSVDLAFGLCHRRLGTEQVILNVLQISEISQCIPGWHIEFLGRDCIARMLVLTTFTDADQLAEQVTRLLRHADLNEQLALYKGLPLYTPSQALTERLADGLRSNISEVFETIAHHNPYAAWHLDSHRFNHMVLKALFIDSKLAPIVSLSERNNAELVRMLLDTARERRAASRPVSDELWTLAQPFMTTDECKEFNLEQVS